jgi:hypothetical protein
MKTRRAKRRARTQTWEQWRLELIERLESLHMLTVEIEAFQAAFEAVYGETSWPSNGDPERRRALNRMSCFVDQVRAGIDDLVRESQEVVEFAMRRAS